MPLLQVLCHCTICQKLTGSVAHNIAYKTEQVCTPALPLHPANISCATTLGPTGASSLPVNRPGRKNAYELVMALLALTEPTVFLRNKRAGAHPLQLSCSQMATQLLLGSTGGPWLW